MGFSPAAQENHACTGQGQGPGDNHQKAKANSCCANIQMFSEQQFHQLLGQYCGTLPAVTFECVQRCRTQRPPSVASLYPGYFTLILVILVNNHEIKKRCKISHCVWHSSSLSFCHCMAHLNLINCFYLLLLLWYIVLFIFLTKMFYFRVFLVKMGYL